MPSTSGMRTSIRTTWGWRRGGLVDRLPPIRGLADDLDVALGLEDHPEPRAHERLIVSDQHAYRGGIFGGPGRKLRLALGELRRSVTGGAAQSREIGLEASDRELVDPHRAVESLSCCGPRS